MPVVTSGSPIAGVKLPPSIPRGAVKIILESARGCEDERSEARSAAEGDSFNDKLDRTANGTLTMGKVHHRLRSKNRARSSVSSGASREAVQVEGLTYLIVRFCAYTMANRDTRIAILRSRFKLCSPHRSRKQRRPGSFA